jgi:hypothetical protein
MMVGKKIEHNPKDVGTIEVTKTSTGKYQYHDPNVQKTILSRIFGESLFGWTPSRERRLSAPEEMQVMKPSIFSTRVLKDSAIFGWLEYLDEDPDTEIDYTAQYTTEYANIGLLSALVFTVSNSSELKHIVLPWQTYFTVLMLLRYRYGFHYKSRD